MKEQSIKNNIAANIAFYRKKNKITQKELADKLHTKNTTVSTWERASSLPDAETLFLICKIFHISLADMYGCDSVPSTTLSINEAERRIIYEYRKADEITQAMVLRALSINDQFNLKGDAEKMA